jgi:hypothetical protein
MVLNRPHLAGGVVCRLRVAPNETLIRRQKLTTLVLNRQLLAAGGVVWYQIVDLWRQIGLDGTKSSTFGSWGCMAPICQLWAIGGVEWY